MSRCGPLLLPGPASSAEGGSGRHWVRAPPGARLPTAALLASSRLAAAARVTTEPGLTHRSVERSRSNVKREDEESARAPDRTSPRPHPRTTATEGQHQIAGRPPHPLPAPPTRRLFLSLSLPRGAFCSQGCGPASGACISGTLSSRGGHGGRRGTSRGTQHPLTFMVDWERGPAEINSESVVLEHPRLQWFTNFSYSPGRPNTVS